MLRNFHRALPKRGDNPSNDEQRIAIYCFHGCPRLYNGPGTVARDQNDQEGRATEFVYQTTNEDG